MNKYKKLLSPFNLAPELSLKNHIIMAPLIQRAVREDGIPNKSMLDFYAQRASAGLIIAEATMISENARAYSRMPGIYNELQLNYWKKIVEAVHAKEGKIFIQLWHPGRISHRSLLFGKQPVAPSPIKANGKIPWSDLDYDMPITMTEFDIDEIIHSFEYAAQNAISVGFDGIEIHAANGYLLEQFLRDETNKRSDKYGGAPTNKVAFPLRIIDAVIKKVGNKKIGVRISLESSNTLKFQAKDIETYVIFIQKLNKYPLAYLHLSSDNDFTLSPVLKCRPSQFLKLYTAHPLIACGSYNPELAEDALRENKCDLVSFGRPFLKNSDFVNKVISEGILNCNKPAMANKDLNEHEFETSTP